MVPLVLEPEGLTASREKSSNERTVRSRWLLVASLLTVTRAFSGKILLMIPCKLQADELQTHSNT